MMAASKFHDGMVDMLLEKGADPFSEDERGCTALCYAISKYYQRKADIASATINRLLSSFSPLETEKYLVRRLQILMNPGKRSDSGNIIETFLSPIFSFFITKVNGSLDMLLKGKVFDIVFQALKNHIGQIEYTVSILGVLAEIVHYCDCCVSVSNPNISENDLYQSFLNSQCPKMCIVILKHSGMPNLRSLGSSIFLPLFLVCPFPCSSGRKWLQDHCTVLQPFYQKYMEFSNIKYNLHVDDAHLKSVKKKVKNFKNLMIKLQNGDSITGKVDVLDNGDSDHARKKAASEKEASALKKIRKKSKIKIAKKGSLDIRPNLEESGGAVAAKDVSKLEQKDEAENKEEESERIAQKPQKAGGYDPSDLFGLLATSRSTGSSEESEASKKSTNNLTDSEKEENRMKQVATAMNTIFSSDESGIFYCRGNDLKPSLEVKQYFSQDNSDDNLEPIKKDLSPALNYLQSLFEDFVAKHRKVWSYEKINNYPDHKTPEDEDEGIHVMKLKIVLSQLEDFYLNSLTEEWDLLMQTIRKKVWYSEEASNDVISKIQELLLKTEVQIAEKYRKIEEEEFKHRYIERKSFQQTGRLPNQKLLTDIGLLMDKDGDSDMYNARFEFLRTGNNDLFLNRRNLKKTSSQSRLSDSERRDFTIDGNLSQGSSGTGIELSTIYFNKGYKSDSHSEIVSIGSKTGSSQSIPTPRTDERKEQYSLWTKNGDNPVERLLKTVRQMNDPPMKNPSKCSFWMNEISNLKKMIANSHVQYGEILLPNPLKSGRILLPYGETGYFGSVEMGLDQKGNPMAVKHVKKSFPTSVDVLSNIMVRLRKINNKYLLPYYMSDGFEPIIATPLMDFNLGQYILHLKTNSMLELKAPLIIKEVVAGLYYLHTQKPPIIHGNLKPSNVFIDSAGVIKLAEFGISVALYLKKPAPPCSMIWWPGEVITSYVKVNKLRCTLAADVATAGMLIHFILSGGQHPFGQQVKEIVDNLIMGKWNLVTSDNNADDLISWMLIFIPENRPSIPAIVRHIYFWNLDKRWKFLLTCAGISDSRITQHDVVQLHNFLDIKAKESNIQGDWKSLILSYFPNCKEIVKNLSPTLTGLLNFLRHCLEERKRSPYFRSRTDDKLISGERFLKLNYSTVSLQSHTDACSYVPYFCDLKSFFFNAFPVIPLSIYRMLEGTQWMEVSFFMQFNEPYELT
ncbi:UNVERIFIED_CONTAM: hypothetical protein PYX00_005144 [Menopon gallinae]|uniref:Protein kinase domain-containing protein n=1 Tax=Menopon gallinae TaxID=328185 RepID=A0AAW2HQ72_9NEOP